MPSCRSLSIALAMALSLDASRSAAAELVGKPAPGCVEPARGVGVVPAAASAVAGLPPQLEMRTPVSPAYFSSGGRRYLVYEVQLRNLSDQAMDIGSFSVLDADRPATPIAVFSGAALGTLLHPVGKEGAPVKVGMLDEGRSAIAFLCLAFSPGSPLPSRLSDRVTLSGTTLVGPDIAIDTSPSRVLGAPVTGGVWTAAGGPGNDSHHRLGWFAVGGVASIARRYAIDWKIIENGSSFTGDALDVNAYHAYGKDVLAVADGVVVGAHDGQPNNVPRTPAGFKTALPVTLDNVAGNFVILDIGQGQYAEYAHLKPGSVRVKKGDRVTRGQVIGAIGASGDAREPHLHFQLSNTPDFFAGEGLPYVIDRFVLHDGEARSERVDELPVEDMRVDFGNPPATRR